MKATVLIPTKGRPAKLLRCIQSIPAHIDIAIHATAAADIPTTDRPLSVSFGCESVVQSFNLLAARVQGAVLPACDDVEFLPGCVESLIGEIQTRSENAVVGAHVINRKHNEDAFVLVGRQIIEERGYLFYPEFRHFFIDFELGRYARATGRFIFCSAAQLRHHHPEVSGEYDDTHRHRRMEKWRHDKAIWDVIRGKTPVPAAAIPQTAQPPSSANALSVAF